MCGLREAALPRSLLVLVIIVIVVVDRAQEMGEGPLGHVAPLLPRLHVRKAKVDSLEDTGPSRSRSTAGKSLNPSPPNIDPRLCPDRIWPFLQRLLNTSFCYAGVHLPILLAADYDVMVDRRIHWSNRSTCMASCVHSWPDSSHVHQHARPAVLAKDSSASRPSFAD
jgi:hypothetical protein